MVAPVAYLLDDPAVQVPLSTLTALGVLHWKIDPTPILNDETSPELKQICDDRKYDYTDRVRSVTMPNLADKLDTFKVEHLHDDEEIRFFLEGSGYFDVRDALGKDEWIRMHLQAGDMIVLPAGIWHRFIPDEKLFFHVMRLFQGAPVWTPYNRRDEESGERPARAKYEREVMSGPNAYLLDNPGVSVTQQRLTKLGVKRWVLDPTPTLEAKEHPELKQLCEERGYTYQDRVQSTKIPNLEEKLGTFKIEHLHDDEEIRYFLEGSGYFDVRDGLSKEDPWIRMHLKAGELIVLPAGVWHRFVPDENLFFHVMRLFVGDPVWTPWNRDEGDNNIRQSRLAYEDQFLAVDKRRPDDEEEVKAKKIKV